MIQLLSFASRLAVLILVNCLCLFSHAQTNDAVNFDGVDDYVSLPPSVAVSQLNTFTIEAWVYWTGAGNACIYSETVQGNDNPMFSISPRSGDAGGIELVLRDNSLTGLVLQPATATITANTWVHVAVVRTSATNIKIYIDGVLKDNASFTAPASWTPDKVNIGIRWRGIQDGPFPGKIDEVRIWNTARTGAEIKANMFNQNLANNATGLVAYYRFNEASGTTAYNSCTNTSPIDGTLTNGPTWTPSPVQFAANALQFNGSSYVELNNRINVGTSDFTIEAWVYPTSTSAGMVFAQDVCGDGEHQFRFYTNNSKVNFDFSDAAALGSAYSFQLPSTANSVPLNTWTQIAITRSGNNYTLYINGVSNATYSTGTNTINNQSGADVNKRLRIGARGGVSTGCGLNYFNGSIDEVRYWNVARTATEIQQNYSKEIDPSANSSLVDYYSFNQGISAGTNTGLTTLTDQKGDDNGTLNGFSLTGSTSNFVAQDGSVIILPLQWLSFTAQSQNSNVILQWTTAFEINTSNFDIQHSTDGKDWKTIANVSAVNQPGKNNYTFVDKTPVAGRNFYRLRQNDFNTKYSYSQIRTVQIDNNGRSFSLISNPVSNRLLQIRVNEASGEAIRLYSAGGSLIWQKQFTAGVHNIDVGSLSSGIYWLKGNAQSEKLLLQ